MLLILEIILTVQAWKKGWKWRALLPVAITMGAAFITGYVTAASGNAIENPFAFIIFDILLIITQIVMIARPREAGSASSVQRVVCANKA